MSFRSIENEEWHQPICTLVMLVPHMYSHILFMPFIAQVLMAQPPSHTHQQYIVGYLILKCKWSLPLLNMDLLIHFDSIF
mgnify:CR=1 FL=1